MGSDNPPELLAVFDGMKTLAPYVQGGGRFTGQKNSYGQTAGMLAASNSAEVIEYFYKAGGRFTDDKDKEGRTAAFYAVNDAGSGSQNHRERPAAIAAFEKFGGRFTDEQDVNGSTAASLVLRQPENVPAFLKAGGRFDNDIAMPRYNLGMTAVMCGAGSIEAFSLHGGKFNSHQVNDRSAGEMAAQRGGEVLEAYNRAVERQGGLVYVSTDDEFSALRTPLRIESFVKTGHHFDDRMDAGGRTAAMWAMYNGPQVAQAFATFGGRFTTQQDPSGDTVESYPRDPQTKAIYAEAVKKQGGLITLKPTDQYEAARIGAEAVRMFAKAGGRFDDKPDGNDMTSAMIAAVSGAATVEAFARAGGRFSDWQNAKGYTAAIVAVISGADTIQAFSRAGGHFTEQQDHNGRTAALWAAARNDIGWPDAQMELHFPGHRHRGGLINEGGAAIKAFAAGGGRFDDHQESVQGENAGMMAVENGPEAIMAFVAAGGRFNAQESKSGYTAEDFAVFLTADRIKAFAAAGGRFTSHISSKGVCSEWVVALAEDPGMITAYSEAGGVFTDRRNARGWTSERLASDETDWFAESLAAQTGRPQSPQVREIWKQRFGARDVAAAKAYQEAIVRQGGVRHVP